MKLRDLLGSSPGRDKSWADLEILGLTADSREVEAGFLFAALPGSLANGADYIADAAARGAVAVLAPAGLAAEAGCGLPVVEDANPRRALALMAARFYGRQPETAVAVTGTNGKTSVAAFMHQIWQAEGRSSASIGTVGTVTDGDVRPSAHTTPHPVALHRTLRALADAGVTHVALEASSHGLAQYRVAGVRLRAAAFTNISRDHLDYHRDFDAYFATKLRLFTEILEPGAAAVIDVDRAEGAQVAEAARGRGLDVVTVGRNGAALRLADAVRDGFGQRLQIDYDGRRHAVRLPLTGDFQAANALVAAGLALATGSAPETVFAALETLQGAKGRLELAGETLGGAPIFIDYAHTPDALANALAALRPYANGLLHVVFGCGGDRDPGKRPQMGEIAGRLADWVIVTDDNPRSEDPAAIRAAILAAVPCGVEIGDRLTAIRTAIADLHPDDVLLIAGKGHETGQIVGDRVLPYSDHDAVRQCLEEARHG